jgi:hypothetical protein
MLEIKFSSFLSNLQVIRVVEAIGMTILQSESERGTVRKVLYEETLKGLMFLE